MERAEILRQAAVDAMVDPGRQLTEDEWSILAWFVGDAESMWEVSERRVVLMRMLAERSVGWLADLYGLRQAIRDHRDETKGSSIYWPADVRLWDLVADDDEGDPDIDYDGEPDD